MQKKESPFACDMTAISPEQRGPHLKMIEKLFKSVLQVEVRRPVGALVRGGMRIVEAHSSGQTNTLRRTTGQGADRSAHSKELTNTLAEYY